MPITVRWANTEQSILLLDFRGTWTWQDMHAANAQADALIKSVPHVVDLITDLTHGGDLPSGALTEARAMMNGFETGTGLIVAVKAGLMVQSLYPIFYKLYGKRAGFPDTQFLDTLDEAYAYIRERRRANRN